MTNFWLTSRWVVTSHGNKAFSMSASFAFSWLRGCGPTRTPGANTGNAEINLRRHRTSVVFTWRHYLSASETEIRSILHFRNTNYENPASWMSYITCRIQKCDGLYVLFLIFRSVCNTMPKRKPSEVVSILMCDNVSVYGTLLPWFGNGNAML